MLGRLEAVIQFSRRHSGNVHCTLLFACRVASYRKTLLAIHKVFILTPRFSSVVVSHDVLGAYCVSSLDKELSITGVCLLVRSLWQQNFGAFTGFTTETGDFHSVVVLRFFQIDGATTAN